MSNKAFSIEELKRIEHVMQAMLIEAANGNWQELNRLDSERRVLIGYQAEESSVPNSSLKTNSNPQANRSRLPDNNDNQSETYRTMCQKLREIDEQLNTMVNSARQQLIEQSRGIRDQVKAKKGYEQTSKAL